MKRFLVPDTFAAWVIVFLGIVSVGVTNTRAASGALIVAGLSGTSANTEEFERLSGETKRLLAERGIPLENVQTLGGKVTREIVLYGHGGRSQGGAPAFQVSGPRLTAPDLKTALDAIPARQFVFIGTSDSGGFLPVLQNGRRTVLSATRADGENGQPRFPGAWVNALAENPRAAFAMVAARAARSRWRG